MCGAGEAACTGIERSFDFRCSTLRTKARAAAKCASSVAAAQRNTDDVFKESSSSSAGLVYNDARVAPNYRGVINYRERCGFENSADSRSGGLPPRKPVYTATFAVVFVAVRSRPHDRRYTPTKRKRVKSRLSTLRTMVSPMPTPGQGAANAEEANLVKWSCITTRRSVAIAALLLASVAPTAAYAQSVATADGLSLTLGGNASVNSVVVDGGELVASSAPAVSVRDLSAAATVFTPNLLYNGSFEIDDGSGGADGWSPYLNNGTEMGIVTDDAAHLLRSFFVQTSSATTADGEAVYSSSAITVAAGTRYRFSAQIHARDGYLALKRVAPEWQQKAYMNILQSGINASGIYVAWYGNSQGSGDPLDVDLAAVMHSNARAWKRITGEVEAPPGVAGARVLIVAKLKDEQQQDDGLWVDDLSMIESPEAELPVTATVVGNGGSLQLSGTVAGTALGVDVSYTGLADRIEISGSVTDSSGFDRALELVLRFPLDLMGFRWWDDIRESRNVASGLVYSNSISSLSTGKLPQSLYPLAALEDGTRGIAMAVPLDDPRVVVFSYRDGTFEARFHLGISQAASRLGSSATFKVYLYRYGADWAFRAALAKLQSFNPAWFDSSRPLYELDSYAQGRFYNPGACLPGCQGSCDECCSGAELVVCYDGENIAAAQYTAPEGPMTVGSVPLPPPTYDEVITQLANPPAGEQDRYAALAASMSLESNGDYVLKHLVNPNWAPNDWEANWVLNMDPDISGGYAQWARVARVDAAFAASQAAGGALDAVQFDNLMSASAIDLDPSHLALADHSLSYDPNSYRPGIHSMASTFEYFAWLRGYLDTNYVGYPGPGLTPALGANIWGIGTLNFLAPFIDALANETSGEGSPNWSTALLDYRRSLAYHKPLGSPWQRSGVTQQQARDYTNITLFYGMKADRAKHGTGWEAGVDDILAAANDTLDRFMYLGWEPVAYASSGTTKTWVERFGDSFSQLRDTIYFTVHNSDTTAAAYSLTVETASLGLADPPAAVVKEVRSDATRGFSPATGTMTVSGYLEAGDTEVIRLMAPGCSATELSSASLKLKPGVNDDRLRMKGRFGSTVPEPDFTAVAVVFVLADRDGDVYQATVPADGFSRSGSGRSFKFKDSSGTIASGLSSAKFVRKRDGSYRWKAKARDVDLSAADRSYLDVMIHAESDCWADSRSCSLNSKATKLNCRP